MKNNKDRDEFINKGGLGDFNDDGQEEFSSDNLID